MVKFAVLELDLSELIVEEGLDVPRFVGVVEVAVLDAEVAEDSFFARPYSHLCIAKDDVVWIICHSSVVDLAVVLLLHEGVALVVGD